MDFIYYVYYAADLLDLAKVYARQYEQHLWIALLVIALLNCFFGYHLRKIWGVLAGTALGAALSAGICIYIDKTGTILYLITVLGAFTLGLLALLLYKVGLFFIGTMMIPFILSRIFPTEKPETLFLWFLLGFVLGCLTLVWERETISLITAICGGFGSSQCLMIILSHHSFLMLGMLGIAFSLAGILLQFQPWRSRSSWNSDEERARDKHRHNRRMKRIRRKKRRQERIEERKNAKKAHASGSRKPSYHPGIRKNKNSGYRSETSEYTPYTTRPMYQAALEARRHYNTDGEDIGPLETSGLLDPERQNVQTANPDLSDVRQAISHEVTDIYQSRQQYMDEALNQLLKREYQNTTSVLNQKTKNTTDDL